MMNFTLGHDAEVFLVDSEGQAIPSIGLIGGNKIDPRRIDKGALQEDNVMAELNIDPAKNVKEWIYNTKAVRKKLEQVISKHGLKIHIASFQQFKPKFLRSKQAKMFGCDPDYNIYTSERNEINSDFLLKNHQRTAGGHIHIGLENPNAHANIRRVLVEACDAYIGLPLASVERGTRKKFYGKSGSYRTKSYGIEYRTPSNIWLENDNFIEYIYNQASAVVNCVEDLIARRAPHHRRIIDSIGQDRFRRIIDGGMFGESIRVCEDIGIALPPNWERYQ